MALAAPKSDAFVFFGATGDLAYKKVFPALDALVRRDGMDIPIIGVAKSGWNLQQLRARARDSIEKAANEQGTRVDEKAFGKLAARFRYIDGDYNESTTFERLKKELGQAKAPLYYLAIPPDMFGSVVSSLKRLDCTRGARVVVEKPFGRDLTSARKLNRILHEAFAEAAIFRIDHYLGKEAVQNLSVFSFREHVPRADLESRLYRSRADHDGRAIWCGRSRSVSTRKSVRSVTSSRIICCR